jgi:HD-GYP domain-containing protein (c-di-GMP phosphodiesterase class II)
MQLVKISVESLRLSQPLTCRLRDQDGRLLLDRGAVIATIRDREALAERGLYVDIEESQEWRRVVREQLNDMMLRGANLGEIAAALVHDMASAQAAPVTQTAQQADVSTFWLDQQRVLSALLHRQTLTADWVEQFQALRARMLQRWEDEPRASLIVLMHGVIAQSNDYSVRHALACGLLCWLASPCLGIQGKERDSLVNAALTMNFGMTELHDMLALQASPPTPTQRTQIQTHPKLSAQKLTQGGVEDPLWLLLVRMHHQRDAQALSIHPNGKPLPFKWELAQMLQATDAFVAQLSPRASRDSLLPQAAVRNVVLEDNKALSQGAAAIIKVTGLYPPGTYVRLVNEETAIVLEAGARPEHPQVAVVQRRDGTTVNERAVRDTSVETYKVTQALPYSSVRVRVDLPKLLARV